MAYTTLEELKKQANIEEGFTEDDTYLNTLINVAELSVKEYCQGGLVEYTDANMPVTVKLAALLLATHLYTNRAVVSFAQATKIPYSFEFLLGFYKNHTVV